MLTPWKESYDQPRQHIQKQKHYFANVMSKLWFFQWSCTDVRVGLLRMLNTKELMLLNCGVGETLESPLDCKEIQLVNLKGNQL